MIFNLENLVEICKESSFQIRDRGTKHFSRTRQKKIGERLVFFAKRNKQGKEKEIRICFISSILSLCSDYVKNRKRDLDLVEKYDSWKKLLEPGNPRKESVK